MSDSNICKRPGKFFKRGYTLIEVLVGITIFALGMMALASLQGGLTRNSSDSNAGTVANNIAEEVIEAFRTFSQIDVDPDGVFDAFEDIADSSNIIERGGVKYNVVSAVTDYYYDSDSGTFTTTKPGSVPYAAMKLVELTVSWDNNQAFQIDEGQQISNVAMGSGSITLTDIISSIPSTSGGKVALNGKISALYSPPVDYNPGANPDIISIQLGQNKFKESTTPLPKVVRTSDLVETRFDVVTYSQDDAGATFLRREEFLALACECTLRLPGAGGEGGLRPAVWGGAEYSTPEFVAKPFGESANNQQSSFCSLCCRDHHDGGTGEDDVAGDPGRSRYNAFAAGANYYDSTFGSLQGDHKHYSRNKQGELALVASAGEIYTEACRMVRKDGFFRVAQDLRQEGLNNFPANYLDETNEVAVYSEYVTDAVTEYESDMVVSTPYEQTPPVLITPDQADPPVTFPASTPGAPTALPTSDGSLEQQLRSRGIYIDYMSDDLRTKINCLDLGGSGDACEVPSVNSALEIIPFYDVQLTWLARWNESPNNNPVDVTNETILNDNAHSRGIASLELGFGNSTVSAAVHKGNLGLTGTDPIDLDYANDEKIQLLYALAFDASTPPPLTTIVISGTISSSVLGVKAADVEIEATDAQCDRTNTGFECFLVVGFNNPRLTISNYAKGNALLLGCSDTLVIHGSDVSTNPWTRFNLPTSSTTEANIVIKKDSCL